MTQEQRLLERIQQARAHLQDAELFHEVFAGTCDTLSLEDVDVSNALPVDRTTVNRWRNGKSVPRPLMRKPVYRFLAARLRKRMNDLGKKQLREEEEERAKLASA